jgi:hypothetical protein
MTPDEAAAIALAFAALSDDVAAAPVSWASSAPSWSTIGEPRSWMDFARRDALAHDIDV